MRASILSLALLASATFFAQVRSPERSQEQDETNRIPTLKQQQEGILKAEHEKSLKDASDLMRLSEELKIDLEKNDRYIISMTTLKKLDEMEKLVKRIRSRMKRG